MYVLLCIYVCDLCVGFCACSARISVCFSSLNLWQVLQQLAAQSLAPTACTTIEEVGSTGVGALTITFLILAVSTIIFITRVGPATSQKVYYYCNVFICGLATMSYFAMLSGQGWTAVAGCRQFFYARYVDWTVTTALIILELGLIAGAEPALIGGVMGADGESEFEKR